MASVTIKRGTEAEVASTAITDGQILFTTDREYNNQIMADVGENRILIGGNNVFTGTRAEYEEALSQGLIFEGMQVNITDDYDRDLDADVIVYDNTTSGLASTTVQGAIDEIDSNVDTLETEVDDCYKTSDTSDITIDVADKIPFYDESATTKKNITLSNLVDTIAPNFGSQIAVSQGNTLDLLDKDGGLIDSVTIETTANNVSYTDTNNIGETDVQGAVDYLADSLNWKLLISQVGTALIQYPSSWHELWVEITGTNVEWYNFQFTVLKKFVENPNRNNPTVFRTGFYASSTDYGDCSLSVATNGLTLQDTRINGVNIKEQSTIRVYYR